MAGFQSTKGGPKGRETAEKPYKKEVFTRWRYIAPPGKRGAYQVLLGPATPGSPPLVTFFLYTHLSISISSISPGGIYCSTTRRVSQGCPAAAPRDGASTLMVASRAEAYGAAVAGQHGHPNGHGRGPRGAPGAPRSIASHRIAPHRTPFGAIKEEIWVSLLFGVISLFLRRNPCLKALNQIRPVGPI